MQTVLCTCGSCVESDDLSNKPMKSLCPFIDLVSASLIFACSCTHPRTHVCVCVYASKASAERRTKLDACPHMPTASFFCLISRLDSHSAPKFPASSMWKKSEAASGASGVENEHWQRNITAMIPLLRYMYLDTSVCWGLPDTCTSP